MTKTKHIVGMGARIKALRLRAGESIQVAATRAGVSIQTWRNAEKFDLATVDTVSLVAQSFGVPTGIINGADESLWVEQ